jgi:hypothetical protein
MEVKIMVGHSSEGKRTTTRKTRRLTKREQLNRNKNPKASIFDRAKRGY